MSLSFSEFHAHVYFTEETQSHAEELYSQIAIEFPDVNRGKFHLRPVGPHPSWMFTMSFDDIIFQNIALWLMKNLNGLSSLVHPVSGDDLKDHTQHAIWFGKQLDLCLDKL